MPGWSIRVIALRGNDIGSEPRLAVARGRDGYIYLAGAYSLYRILDLNGAVTRIADLSPCDGYKSPSTVDDTTYVPSVVCGDGLQIAVVGQNGRRSIPVRRPNSPAQTPDQVFYGGPSVYEVHPTGFGGYWFVYRFAQGIGEVSRDRQALLPSMPTLVPPLRIVSSQGSLFIADSSCRIERVQASGTVSLLRAQRCADGSGHPLFAIGVDHSVWWADFGSRQVRNLSSRNVPNTWVSPIAPRAIAGDGHGNALIFGYDLASQRVQLARITGGRMSAAVDLPVNSFDDVMLDARGRLWMTDPHNHALVVATPP